MVGVAYDVINSSPFAPGAKDTPFTAEAAAIHLGITPELLFAYALHAPKCGQKRRLKYHNALPTAGFDRAELDAWDAYLREPWPARGDQRAEVPSYVESYLKVESGGRCTQCGRGHPLETAHITSWSKSRSNHHHNLIRLCADCHTKFDQDLITREDIYRLKLAAVERLRHGLRVAAVAGGAAVYARAPNPDPSFVGRTDELAWLADRLTHCRLVSIEGVGGIGKTQLLLRALGPLTELPVVWVDVESAPSRVGIETAIAVGLAQHRFPAVSDSAVEALRDLRVRVVLDGLEHVAQTQWDEILDLLGELARHTAAPRFVLTSQVELLGVPLDDRITIDPLPFEHGLAMLHGVDVGANAPVSDISELVAFCDGHPLALRLVEGLLGYLKSTVEVLRRLRLKGSAALVEPTRKVQTTASSLWVCLAVAYDALTDDERAVLHFVALFPGGCLSDWTSILVRVGDVPMAIAGCRRWHLLEARAGVDGLSRLHLLGPVRSYLGARARESAPEADAVLRREVMTALAIQADHLDKSFLRSDAAAWGIARFEADLPNFLGAIEAAAAEEKAAMAAGAEDARARAIRARLTGSLAAYMFSRNLLKLGARVLRDGVEACGGVGAYKTSAYLLSHLIAIHDRRGDLEGMRATTSELEALAGACRDPDVAAHAQLARGDVALRERRFDVAAASIRLAVAHYGASTSSPKPLESQDFDQAEDAGVGGSVADRGMLAVAEGKLGRAYLGLEDREAALAAYLRALALNEAIPFPINIATTLHELGNIFGDLGRIAEARDAYKRAAGIFTHLATPDFISNSLCELGLLLGEESAPTFDPRSIPSDVLEFGLEDVAQIFSEALRRPWSEWPRGQVASQCLRKFFGVVALVSASVDAQLMAPWARGLRGEMLVPVLATLPPQRDLPPSATKLLLGLDVGLAMAGTIGSVDKGRAAAIAGGVVDALAEMAYLLESGGLSWARPFEWIRAWVGRDGDIAPPGAADLRARGERAARARDAQQPQRRR